MDLSHFLFQLCETNNNSTRASSATIKFAAFRSRSYVYPTGQQAVDVGMFSITPSLREPETRQAGDKTAIHV